MFADITFDNIFSGLIGAFLGVLASFGLSWWNSIREARDALREQLINLKIFKVYQTGKGRSDFLKIYHETYPCVLSAILAYRSRLPAFLRCKIDKALYYYRAGDKPDRLSFVKYSHVDVSTDEEFQQRIDRLLDAIETTRRRVTNEN